MSHPAPTISHPLPSLNPVQAAADATRCWQIDCGTCRYTATSASHAGAIVLRDHHNRLSDPSRPQCGAPCVATVNLLENTR